MAFRKFFKDNFVIISGIILPVLLVVFLFISTEVTRSLESAPEYSVIYSSKKLYIHNYKHSIDENGNLSTCLVPPLNNYNYNFKENDGIVFFIYHPITNKFEKYDIDSPTEYDDKLKCIPLKLPKELRNLKIIDNNISPDGYRLEKSYNYSNGILNIFTPSYRNNDLLLIKNRNRVKIYNSELHPYRVNFIGWVDKNQGVNR